jgi:hypothetical protein
MTHLVFRAARVLSVLTLSAALGGLLGGCRTSAGGENQIQGASLNTVDAERGGTFVGCRPSLGECQNSCAERDGKGFEDRNACPENQGEGVFACYCGSPPAPLPEPPSADDYDFIGCRPSQGECFNSCNSRKGVSYKHPEVCPVEAGDGEFACFCEKSE